MPDFNTETFHDDDEFQARLDELLNSALQDQAREKRVLIETVHGAKSALDKAHEELVALRAMVDKRDMAVVDMLEARLSGVGTEQTLEEVVTKVESLLKRPEANEVIAPVAVRIDSLAARIEDLGGSVKKVDVWGPASEIQRSVASKTAELLAPIASALEDVSSKVTEMSTQTDVGLEALASQVRIALDPIPEATVTALGPRLASLEESLAGDIDVAQEAVFEHVTLTGKALGEHVQGIIDRVDDRLAVLREAALDSRERLEASLERTVGEMSAVIEAAGQKTDTTIQGLMSATQSSDARIFDRMQKIHEGFTGMTSRLAEVVDEIDERLEEARTSHELRNAAVAKHVEGIREVIAQGEQTRDDIFARNIAEITKTFVDERQLLAEAIGEALGPFIIEVERIGERLRQTNRRITESNTRIEAFQDSMIQYLAERDQRLEEVRDAVIADVLERAGEGLRGRERKNLIDAWKEAQVRRADRRDAERFRMMKNHPSVKEPRATEVRAAIEINAGKLVDAPASELLAEVEAEMPLVTGSALAEPEKELMLDQPTELKRPASKTKPKGPQDRAAGSRSVPVRSKGTKKKAQPVDEKTDGRASRAGGARKRAV